MSAYLDGRPEAHKRIDAVDAGVVLRHGDGPDRCDVYGAREAWVFEHAGRYFMHYDAAGDRAWLCSRAVSDDGIHWTKDGAVLDLGRASDDDSGTASAGFALSDGVSWHMFYVGCKSTTPPPDRIPSMPYFTLKARATSPAGPWEKQPGVVPFRTRPNTYYSDTASPGHVVRLDGEYLQFFSAATHNQRSGEVKRTIGIARTRDLDGMWTPDPEPILPLEEQLENAALYFETNTRTWFLFANHVGIDLDAHGVPTEYTDAIWVYWSSDLTRWKAHQKAVVLDGRNCTWSRRVIGMPSVVPIGQRLALYYDGYAGEGFPHMHRDIGLAWIDLPMQVPALP